MYYAVEMLLQKFLSCSDKKMINYSINIINDP